MGNGGSRRSRTQHALTCAEQVRRYHLDRIPTPDDLRAETLHAIAWEIVERCGHDPLRAHRLSWGWTVPEAVEAFHAMCRRERIKPRGLVVRSWQEWEAGSRPSWDYQDLLSRLFHANPVQLGWASDYTPNDPPPVRAGPRPDLAAVGADAGGSLPPGYIEDPGIVLRVSTGEHGYGGRALLHLPPDIDDFTGRGEQADRVARLIAAEDSRSNTAVPIVTISGQGGIGKTALALHVAHEVMDRFPDGQMYTNLRGAEAQALDPAEVLAGFLRELGVDGVDIPERLDDRARMYRSRLAGQGILVVLDNAADEAQVRPLLPGSPGCAVLVTSRSRMAALAGSHAVPLDVMPSEQAGDLLAAIVGQERADAEPEAIAEIARVCGHLPLAIRIAGARLQSRPAWRISWFADRLRDESRRLDLLKAGDLEIRASFALSYQSRSPKEQQAFRLAGMLPTDFPAWTLAALLNTDADPAEQLLEDLVDAQLVEIIGVDATGLLRYGLHDLLRVFARECLSEIESPEIQRDSLARLVEQYIAAADIGAALLEPGSLQENAEEPPLVADVVHDDPRNWFSAERANLISMVLEAHTAGLWEQTWRLAKALPVMFNWRADWRAWEQTHQLALEGARRAEDELAEATILRSLGMLYRELGQYDRAAAMLAEASEIFFRHGDEHNWATALRHLGDTYRYQGLLHEAIRSFSASLEVFQRLGDSRSVAGALNGMADAHRGLSQWGQAEDRFDRCIVIYREIDDQLERARSTVRFAMVFRDRNLNDQATSFFRNALAVFRDLTDRRWEARTMRHLAVLHRQDGKIDTALQLFEQCLSIFDELADRRGRAVTLRNRGDAHRCNDDHVQADQDLREALAIFEDIGDRRWAARTHLSIAGMRRCEKNWTAASHHIQAALDTFRDIQDRPAQGRALRELGMLRRDQGELPEALAAITESRAIFAELGDELWIARTLASQAHLDGAHGRDPASRLAEAAEICERNGISGKAKIALVLKEW